MGEISNMIIDGDMCETCGQLMDGNGYPQQCQGCQPQKKRPQDQTNEEWLADYEAQELKENAEEERRQR